MKIGHQAQGIPASSLVKNENDNSYLQALLLFEIQCTEKYALISKALSHTLSCAVLPATLRGIYRHSHPHLANDEIEPDRG